MQLQDGPQVKVGGQLASLQVAVQLFWPQVTAASRQVWLAIPHVIAQAPAVEH